ncbi:cysteine synthase A [candidate division KSB1 bacterium]|nr:cysteine synthase A [candidate division KSB1 bacterium]
MIHANILETVGNTPLVRIKKLVQENAAQLIAKLESFNPGGSVKDRIALNMVEDAERRGILCAGGTIIEPTSGNTGIGLAMTAAAKGYQAIFTMPASMSIERRALLRQFGAKIILTPAEKGMQGAIEKAESLAEIRGYFMPYQFRNPANPEAHRRTTAREIIAALNGQPPDYFVAGVGTGGTITGAGEVLKAANPDIQIVAVEPEDSPVLSGGKPGSHKIQGIGAGFIPQILNMTIVDDIIRVSNKDAFETAKKLAQQEGILAGISSGANLFAAISIANSEQKGKRVLVILPDTGERYISTELFEH